MRVLSLMLVSLWALAQDAAPDPMVAELHPDLHGLAASWILTADEALVSTTLPLEADHFNLSLRVRGDGVDQSWTQGPYGANDTPLVNLPEEALPGDGQRRQVIARVTAFDGGDHAIAQVHLNSFYANADGGVISLEPEPAPVVYIDHHGRSVVETNPAGGE